MYYLKGQKRFNDCGVACCATILGLYGLHYNYKKLGNADTFLDILVILKSYNIDCKAIYNKDINTFPCIVQVKRFGHYHFVVIYEEKDNKFIYYSPNKLVIHKKNKKRFLKYYTKKAIIINKKEQYHHYEINLKSLPYSIKLILFDIFLIILIISLLSSNFFVL